MPAEPGINWRPMLAVLAMGGLMIGVAGLIARGEPEPGAAGPISTTTSVAGASAPVDGEPEPGAEATTTTTTTMPLPQREPDTVPAWTVGLPWGDTVGLTMFRGNPTRTWYGTGPLPAAAPSVAWRYPDGPMCGSSSEGGTTRTWCGTGWTGQPVVWERPDGTTEVIFGAYDRSVHFVDAATGRELRAPFRTGDIIKGSVTLDPDGYPLLYFGSRDNKLRIVALDRDAPTELWSLDANAVKGIWNNDWDANPVIVDDIMYQGGENSWFFAVELNRGYAPDGKVAVDPRIAFKMPGWTDELIAKVGRNVSIENSPAVFEQRVYYANSGGRVVGLDVSRVREGDVDIVLDYWVGDDVDATIVVDGEGMIYVSVEDERKNARSKELGQLIKLDPSRPDDPYVWGVPVPGGNGDGGLWATPALGDGVLYASTHTGRLLAVDTGTGEVVWEDEVGWHAWSSPVIVDDRLLVATCSGELRLYSIEEPRAPRRLWSVQGSESCIESTPAVWKGVIYVGARDGYFRAYR